MRPCVSNKVCVCMHVCMLCFVLGKAFWGASCKPGLWCAELWRVCWLLVETCCAGSWHAAAKEDKGETAKVSRGSCAVSFQGLFACRWKRGMTGHAAVAAPSCGCFGHTAQFAITWHTA